MDEDELFSVQLTLWQERLIGEAHTRLDAKGRRWATVNFTQARERRYPGIPSRTLATKLRRLGERGLYKTLAKVDNQTIGEVCEPKPEPIPHAAHDFTPDELKPFVNHVAKDSLAKSV